MVLPLILIACGDAEDRVRSGDPEATHNEAAASPASEATPTKEATAQPEEDPRDVLVELLGASSNEDYRAIYEHLSDRFQQFEYDEQWVRRLAPRGNLVEFFAGEPASAEAFKLEKHDAFAVVRLPEMPQMAYVFVPENGEWRLEPGDLQLLMTAVAHRSNSSGGPLGMGSPDDYQFEYETDHPNLSLLPLVNFWFYGVAVHDSAVDIALEWEIGPVRTPQKEAFDGHLLNDIIIPLDGLSWHAADASGDVKVVRTTAVLENDRFRLPGWPEETAEDARGESGVLRMSRYRATLRLVGVPADADEITLRTEKIIVGPFGDDAPIPPDERVTYSFEHYFPAETTHDILAGEAPDIEKGETHETSNPDDPVPHEELPNSPLGDAFTVADVDYERSDDAVVAHIVIDPGDNMVEWVGQDHRVKWSDGVETEVLPQYIDGRIEIAAERTEPPFDAEVTEVLFSELTRSLERDPDATFYQDRIETKWGAFPILNIVEQNDGSAVIEYQPVGHRWIKHVTVFSDNGQVEMGATGTSFNEEFRPYQSSMSTPDEFMDIQGSLPLPAEAEVWEATADARIEIP